MELILLLLLFIGRYVLRPLYYSRFFTSFHLNEEEHVILDAVAFSSAMGIDENERRVNDDFYNLKELSGDRKTQDPEALLNQVKLAQIKTFAGQFSILQAPLAPMMKKLLADLNTACMQYEAISKKIHNVYWALEQKACDLINDDLIAFNEVKSPILLVKQYQKMGAWHAVPACSYVTNESSFLTWFLEKGTHPASRDKLLEPNFYNGMPTRYVWHHLTKECCAAQEINEAAESLLILLDDLEVKFKEIPKKDIPAGLSIHSLFTGSTAASVPNENRGLSLGMNV